NPGNAAAQLALARLYDQNRGITGTPEERAAEARRLYGQAAASDDPDAQYFLGRLFEQNRGITIKVIERLKADGTTQKTAQEVADEIAALDPMPDIAISPLQADGTTPRTEEEIAAATTLARLTEAARLYELASRGGTAATNATDPYPTDTGQPDAQNALARFYEEELGGVPGDDDARDATAVRLLKAAANGTRTNPEAQYKLATRYAESRGVTIQVIELEKDDGMGGMTDKTAMEIADEITALAPTEIAISPLNSDGTERDTTQTDTAKAAAREAETIRLLELASRGPDSKEADPYTADGHGPAQYALAQRYEKAIGLTADLPKAQELYELAAPTDQARQLTALASQSAPLTALTAALTEDQITLADLEIAAEGGDPAAQQQLGIDYQAGNHGLTADPVQAHFWLTRAKTQYEADSTTPTPAALTTALDALMLTTDQQTIADLLFTATNGDAEDQQTLGTHYKDGTSGLTTDNAQAYLWLSRANAQYDTDDDTPAPEPPAALTEALAELTTGDPDAMPAVAALLTAAQITALDLQLQAESANAQAQYDLALLYQADDATNGVTMSNPQAYIWLTRARANGHPTIASHHPVAAHVLGRLYEDGTTIFTQDYAEAGRWYQRAANATPPYQPAQLRLAALNDRGLTAPPEIDPISPTRADGNPKSDREIAEERQAAQQAKRDEQAVALYTPLSTQTADPAAQAWAQYGLGQLHQEGRGGLDQDYVKAIELYRQAIASTANPDAKANAQRALAIMLDFGCGQDTTKKAECVTPAPEKREEAATLLMASAAAGNQEAQIALAHRYLIGRIDTTTTIDETGKSAAEIAAERTVLNQREAASLYRQAADAGNANAQIALAQLYESNRGVDGTAEERQAQAATYYRMAANQGNLEGFYQLGRIAERADPPEWQRALGWYRFAAQAGHPRSQTRLAQLYERGIIITPNRGIPVTLLPQDVAEAERLYRAAAQVGRGYAPAQTGLAILLERNLVSQRSTCYDTTVSQTFTRTENPTPRQVRRRVQALRAQRATCEATYRQEIRTDIDELLRAAACPGVNTVPGTTGFAADFTCPGGHAPAQYLLGRFIYSQQSNHGPTLDSNGIPTSPPSPAPDYTQVVKFYRLAAAQGNTDAQNALAVLYENQEGVIALPGFSFLKSDGTAKTIPDIAQELNANPATRAMNPTRHADDIYISPINPATVHFTNSDGTPRTPAERQASYDAAVTAAARAKAIEFYQLAVEQGHADAQYNLGMLRARGVLNPSHDPDDAESEKYTTEPDHEEAERLYELAAVQGHAPAQAALAALIAIDRVRVFEEGNLETLTDPNTATLEDITTLTAESFFDADKADQAYLWITTAIEHPDQQRLLRCQSEISDLTELTFTAPPWYDPTDPETSVPYCPSPAAADPDPALALTLVGAHPAPEQLRADILTLWRDAETEDLEATAVDQGITVDATATIADITATPNTAPLVTAIRDIGTRQGITLVEPALAAIAAERVAATTARLNVQAAHCKALADYSHCAETVISLTDRASTRALSNRHTAAARLYRQAADLGDAIAQTALAALYQAGTGVDGTAAERAAESKRLYELAAAQGHQPAQAALLNLAATAATSDPAEAARLYLRLYQQEYATATTTLALGKLYAAGTGLGGADPTTAALWFERSLAAATATENAEAITAATTQILEIAKLRATAGANYDADAAARLYRLAAQAGNSEASQRLASFVYAPGVGTSPNREQAYLWLSIAIAQDSGNSGASSLRATIQGPIAASKRTELEADAAQCIAQDFTPIYKNGICQGPPQTPAQLHTAAEIATDPAAAWRLAQSYAAGTIGIAPDNNRAYLWATIALRRWATAGQPQPQAAKTLYAELGTTLLGDGTPTTLVPLPTPPAPDQTEITLENVQDAFLTHAEECADQSYAATYQDRLCTTPQLLALTGVRGAKGAEITFTPEASTANEDAIHKADSSGFTNILLTYQIYPTPTATTTFSIAFTGTDVTFGTAHQNASTWNVGVSQAAITPDSTTGAIADATNITFGEPANAPVAEIALAANQDTFTILIQAPGNPFSNDDEETIQIEITASGSPADTHTLPPPHTLTYKDTPDPTPDP
ncbi:MAG: sel1 repeat family protein, partial [Cellvibrionales bacterium]|nr:sel1 repeat family protein [Cellvibrionales bacterium]